MKKILVSAILGLAAVASVQAQSAIRLYNYQTPSSGSITYAAGATSSTGTGQGVSAGGYSVGIYFAIGDITAAVNSFMGGATTSSANNLSLVGSGLTLSTTANSTANLGSGGFNPGDYGNDFGAVLTGVSGNALVTVVLVAYNGSSYEASNGGGNSRGHSAAFTMTANASPAFPLLTGDFAGPFSVAPVPEPSTFALAGLGLASLLIFRRRK